MALFEKRYTNKVLLDDTEQLTSVIENARTIDGHTVCALLYILFFLSVSFFPPPLSLLILIDFNLFASHYKSYVNERNSMIIIVGFV